MFHLEAGLRADFEKLYGLDGLSGYVQILDDRGGRTNERHVGSFMGASNLEVATAATRVFHAWVQKEAYEGRLSTLFGLYPIDSEFQVIESAGMFTHPAYGPTAELSLTNLPSIFPVSALGLRVRGQTADGGEYVQAALLDGVPGDPNHPKGTYIRFKDGEGTFGIVEAGMTAGTEESGRGLPGIGIPGKLALGTWGYSTRAPDLVDSNIQRRRYGAYALADVQLWQLSKDAGRNVMGFIRYSGTDGNSSAIRRSLNLGLRINGPLASRPDDAFGIAFTRSTMGSKYRQAQTLASLDSAAHEDALEIDYRAQVTPWLVVQPLAQHHHHPAADPSVRDSTLVGIRVEVAL